MRCIALILMLVYPLTYAAGQQHDSLPSWNNTKTKHTIVRFVDSVVDKNSREYVPPSARIAVFDNDGTLWAEQPLYVQLAFVLDRVRALAPKHPEWRQQEPFKSILNGDVKSVLTQDKQALITLVMATHAGNTTDEFAQIVKAWIRTAKHPTTKRRYTDMVYQPMLELLDYLRANEFKTFIVSGGGIEFLRVFAEEIYGIPPEQVIGSSIKTKFDFQNNKPVLIRLAEIDFINDKAGKPVAINRHIGRRPIVAFGNSDGDLPMLQWTMAGKGARLAALVQHTDASREWAYDRQSAVGRLDKALDAAQQQAWTVIDMQRDWKVIFPFDQ